MPLDVSASLAKRDNQPDGSRIVRREARGWFQNWTTNFVAPGGVSKIDPKAVQNYSILEEMGLK
ncbi:hypothetical protein NEOLI_005154 [Neolecta irregularis DAH-3]|uniref:Uncharacterized protein n=1 Tax=Neolecta irregularis (strain DAH-3) TaxID=1198029 RepID=A0A1U7LI03_NEOID|nr:hypothetical protein NEOLI_005154 [Neolecta irregularis DAH-3]|eukprot:OLL22274.1 hypothetical protein NEOLI_005154 [Neolecta irregularis DAH-3]